MCKNMKKTTTPEDSLSKSVAMYAANKLPTTIVNPISMSDLLPNLSKKKELMNVMITWKIPSPNKSLLTQSWSLFVKVVKSCFA